MKKIALYGTSLLAPASPHWRSLPFELRFADYGAWQKEFFESPLEDGVVWSVFLDDLFTGKTLAVAERERSRTAELVQAALAPLSVLLKTRMPVLVLTVNFQRAGLSELARGEGLDQDLERAFAESLLNLQREFPNLHWLPLEQAFALQGLGSLLDSRNYYAARCRFSIRGIRFIAEAVAEVCGRWYSPRKKVLVLDCDNTLWGGVIGEAGLNGIKLGQDGIGQAYVDFQWQVKRLAEKGVVLAIASKNNERDVLDVLEKHPAMVLKREDFAAFQVNWDDKASNLVKIAEELSVGPDSLVFWDDNPIEREMAKKFAPKTVVVDVPADIFDWPAQLKALPEFSQPILLAEDRKKNEQYKARAKFQAELGAHIDRKSYLNSIGMRAFAVEINAGSIDRAVQLCAKTNQFNLRTKRHDRADIEAIIAAGAVGFLGRLEDKFGDHGIVGLLIGRPLKDPSLALLDTFLLSCRVIGRHFEAWMLAEGLRRLRAKGTRYVIGEFVKSERNEMAKDFLAQHGFHPTSSANLLEAARRELGNGDFLFFDLENDVVPHQELWT